MCGTPMSPSRMGNTNRKQYLNFKHNLIFKRRKTSSQKWVLIRSSLSVLVATFLLLIPEAGAGVSHRHRHGELERSRSRVRRTEDEIPKVDSYISNTRSTDSLFYSIDSGSARSVSNGNSYKPTFINCGSYRPEILEGEDVGTRVIKVTATDQDEPSAGGLITYSIVETTDEFFTIDSQTGWIYTNKKFDRDEPAREKSMYVNVRATDNGRPQLDDVCMLNIKILDRNDNPPMFDKYGYGHGSRKKEYKESIPFDLPLDSVVMRISATDIDDGSNGAVRYILDVHSETPSAINYFAMNQDTGEVKLTQRVPEQTTYKLIARATDSGSPPLSSNITVQIKVVEPNQKPPYFKNEYLIPIQIRERSFDAQQPVAEFTAESGLLDSNLVFFELVNGQTQATNKDGVFTHEASENKLKIKVENPPLDYELVNEYTLTIRVTNRHHLAVTTVLKIQVLDENDEKPAFNELKSGKVLENEQPGTSVMRLHAHDKDGTEPNNLVSYSLDDKSSKYFRIDANTGEIFTTREFDREDQDIYQVTVIARDGAPSVLPSVPFGEHNERREPIKIEIADKNDNPPIFKNKFGYAAEIAENGDINSKVLTVEATDKDTEADITYYIDSGDPLGHFAITKTSTSGEITIQKQLDYERVRAYNLTVRASDGVHSTTTHVIITVTNVNDEPPKFERMKNETTIQEESIPGGCIFTVEAYDPDIQSRSEPQNISYQVGFKNREYFSVDNNGCVRVIEKLNRDLPNGSPFHQFFISANDEWGIANPKFLSTLQELTVKLTDINDNAPFLNSTNPVIWYENQEAGDITVLTAMDYDDESINGPPFTYEILNDADYEIRHSFAIEGSILKATKRHFDRERQKEYKIPIYIKDRHGEGNTSILTVIIGDRNDNPMFPGESEILVYKYKENSTISIGRVYVNDSDDWDLPDKTFYWANGKEHSDFGLAHDGTLSMRPSARNGTYNLDFYVIDESKIGARENVSARVIVTVKQITEEAVLSSGSIRFIGITKHDFVRPDATGKSRADKLRAEIADILEIPENNVDIFTILSPDRANDPNIVDVRFSAHNSPYYSPEKLDGILSQHKERLEKTLNANILMIKVDECIRENKDQSSCGSEVGCTNKLVINDRSSKIFTNTSSFVGVDAYVEPICQCFTSTVQNSCNPNPCLYGGACLSGPHINGFKCECKEGHEGKRCEVTSIAFDGKRSAWFESLHTCSDSKLEIGIKTLDPNGLIFYNGPTYKSSLKISDFISLELSKGVPILLLDYGTGVSRLSIDNVNLADDKDHSIFIQWTKDEISMSLDDCPKKASNCFAFTHPKGSHYLLNVNSPLELGGISFNPAQLQSYLNWDFIPTTKNFTGCIANLSLNGEYYDLGTPRYVLGNYSTCGAPIRIPIVANLGVGLNFIIILIICILVLLLLVIAIVFYRRSHKLEEGKAEPGDDVRENIINYSDEGGGEGDQTGYDLSVLMKAKSHPYPSPEYPLKSHNHMNGEIPVPGGVGTWLEDGKSKVDKDPDGLPFDDVRNYAYEGDGNSVGSLSSLASGTDDEDLSFDYLPSFGPRFKKLADMYGGESSDEERTNSTRPPEAWC